MRRYRYWRVYLNGKTPVPTEGEADAHDENTMLRYINDLNRASMLADLAHRWHYWMDAEQLINFKCDTLDVFEHRGSRS